MKGADIGNGNNATGLALPSVAWHALPGSEIVQKLESSLDGLTDAQVLERRREFGRNVLPVKKPPTALVIFLHQFLSPLIYILLAAGIVAIVMGDVTDASFIFAVVLLNAGLGGFQEWKADRSAASLQKLLDGVFRSPPPPSGLPCARGPLPQCAAEIARSAPECASL
jgi:magnesium-transporting ATPase (P-type)